MKYGYIIILTVLLYCCKSANQDSGNQNTVSRNIKESLQGVWAVNDQENASLIFDGDSVEGWESEKSHKYSIDQDTLIIFLDIGQVKYFILKLDSDSLVMKNEFNEIQRLQRIMDHTK